MSSGQPPPDFSQRDVLRLLGRIQPLQQYVARLEGRIEALESGSTRRDADDRRRDEAMQATFDRQEDLLREVRG